MSINLKLIGLVFLFMLIVSKLSLAKQIGALCIIHMLNVGYTVKYIIESVII